MCVHHRLSGPVASGLQRALAASDAAAGLLLIVMAIAAMVAANSRLAGFYHTVLHAPLPGPAPLADCQA